MSTNHKQPLLTEFAARLRLAMKAKGLRQRTLAERIGCSRNQVANLARGVCFPRLKLLAQLRAVLGVSLDWLVLGVDAGDYYGA